MEEDSILNSIKGMLGIQGEDDGFDQEILININTVLSFLYQIGVGEPKHILGAEETWNDIFQDDSDLIDLIKSYTFLRVRVIFDPPSSSYVLNSYIEQIDELEWRIHIQAEGGFDNDSDTESDE